MRRFFIQQKKSSVGDASNSGEATLFTRIRKRNPDIQIKVSTRIKVDIREWERVKKAKTDKPMRNYLESILARPNIEGLQADALSVLLEMSEALDELSRMGIFDKKIIDKTIDDIYCREEREKKRAEQERLKALEETKQREIEQEVALRKADVILFLENYVSGMRDGSIKYKGDNYTKNTVKMWNNFLGIIRRFREIHPFSWDDINRMLTDSFIQFMENEGYMASAINKYITCFRAMVGYAMEQGLHDNAKALSVFSKRKVKESEKAKEIYLTADELQALYEMELTGLKATIRDVFLVGCYTCQRFSDYSRLEREHFTTTAKGTRVVRLTQTKTGNVVVIPILNDNLLNIAERYNYEIPKVVDVILNRYIKDILKQLSAKVPSLAVKERTVLTMKERAKEEKGEITYERDDHGYAIKPRYELVSSHTARRSGITNLYLTGRYDTFQMMSISGHRDVKTFTEYIKLSSDEIADEIAKRSTEKVNDMF